MYNHILITTDGSENAGLGLEHGIALASSIGAAVTILTVTPPFPIAAAAMGAGAYTPAAVLEGYDQAQRETAERILRPPQSVRDMRAFLQPPCMCLMPRLLILS